MKTLKIETNKNGTLIEGLTSGESNFFRMFLANNGCGAKTPADLLEDNFSCQAMEDLREMTGLSNNQIGGFISSLQEKLFIFIEVRKGDCDLYWISDCTLEELPQDWDFTEEVEILEEAVEPVETEENKDSKTSKTPKNSSARVLLVERPGCEDWTGTSEEFFIQFPEVVPHGKHLNRMANHCKNKPEEFARSRKFPGWKISEVN